MSVTERDPEVVDCTPSPAGRAELLEPREVPLGGPRAMRVQRSLPQRSRSLIGAWCFIDHYGPDDLSERGGMRVPGHPHTGLATVTWLFEGEVEHRDTTGAVVTVRPGEVNLMTAGRGVAHSEYSTPATTVVHGAQLGPRSRFRRDAERRDGRADGEGSHCRTATSTADAASSTPCPPPAPWRAPRCASSWGSGWARPAPLPRRRR